MKLKYDPKADAIYIYFSDKKITRTEEVREDFIADFSGKSLVGLEILDVSKKVPSKNLESVSVSISATAES